MPSMRMSRDRTFLHAGDINHINTARCTGENHSLPPVTFTLKTLFTTPVPIKETSDLNLWVNIRLLTRIVRDRPSQICTSLRLFPLSMSPGVNYRVWGQLHSAPDFSRHELHDISGVPQQGLLLLYGTGNPCTALPGPGTQCSWVDSERFNTVAPVVWKGNILSQTNLETKQVYLFRAQKPLQHLENCFFKWMLHTKLPQG